MGSFSALHWVITAAIVWGIFSIVRGALKKTAGTNSVCPSCGTQANPKIVTRGNLAIEIVLWLCMIIPGLIYSIWRMSTKFEACPACGQQGMIPAETPKGRSLIEQFGKA